MRISPRAVRSSGCSARRVTRGRASAARCISERRRVCVGRRRRRSPRRCESGRARCRRSAPRRYRHASSTISSRTSAISITRTIAAATVVVSRAGRGRRGRDPCGSGLAAARQPLDRNARMSASRANTVAARSGTSDEPRRRDEIVIAHDVRRLGARRARTRGRVLARRAAAARRGAPRSGVGRHRGRADHVVASPAAGRSADRGTRRPDERPRRARPRSTPISIAVACSPAGASCAVHWARRSSRLVAAFVLPLRSLGPRPSDAA